MSSNYFDEYIQVVRIKVDEKMVSLVQQYGEMPDELKSLLLDGKNKFITLLNCYKDKFDDYFNMDGNHPIQQVVINDIKQQWTAFEEWFKKVVDEYLEYKETGEL